MKTLTLILVLVFSGCASTPVIHGIPNFRIVDLPNKVYRGGQPTIAGFQWLKTNGVTTIIKLNKNSEGSDIYAETNGIRVIHFPLNLRQQLGVETIQAGSLEELLANIPQNKIYFHCSHGQDRTGLFCAERRVLIDKWTRQAAEHEMLDDGFHKSLFGLWDYWKDKKCNK